VLAVADSANGVSAVLSWDEWLFINTELTVHFRREPRGEWICLDAETSIAHGGAGPRSPRAEHRGDQPGEALVELLAPQPVDHRRSLRPLLDQPGLAQDAEVVRARGLRDRQVEGVAAALALLGQAAHDLEPDRVGQGVQDAGELERVGRRVVERAGHVFDCTTFIERLVRWSSYFRRKGPA
jgi:hypothetical protein